MKDLVYVVDDARFAGGVSNYADVFEMVISNMCINYKRVNAYMLLNQDEKAWLPDLIGAHVHFEFSNTSVNVFRLFNVLVKKGHTRMTGTVHDSPFLVWGVSSILFPITKKNKIVRKIIDLLWGYHKEIILARKLNRVFTLTEAGKIRLINRIGYDKSKVSNIRHVSIVNELALHAGAGSNCDNGDKIKILFFGEMRKDKGLEALLEAIPKLDQRKYEFHVIGDGLMRKHFIDCYTAKHGGPKLVYHGKVNDKILKEMLSVFDIAIFPYKRSITIGASGALVKVMESAVCPLVPDDQAGLLEYVKNGETGLVYKKGELLELLDTLNYDNLEMLGKNAHRYMKVECSVDAISARLKSEKLFELI